MFSTILTIGSHDFPAYDNIIIIINDNYYNKHPCSKCSERAYRTLASVVRPCRSIFFKGLLKQMGIFQAKGETKVYIFQAMSI